MEKLESERDNMYGVLCWCSVGLGHCVVAGEK